MFSAHAVRKVGVDSMPKYLTTLYHFALYAPSEMYCGIHALFFWFSGPLLEKNPKNLSVHRESIEEPEFWIAWLESDITLRHNTSYLGTWTPL